ncbi:MAG: DinB family protein [Planctomycetota bacterium]
MKRQSHPEIELLLNNLDDAYDDKGWHGPTLRAVSRAVPLRQAVWRPQPKRHNIAEIVVHAAYWKYAVRRRLRGDKRGSFPLKGSDWFVMPASLSEEAWRTYLKLLDAEHRILREAVANLPPARLHKTPERSKVSYAKLIYGVAAHDLYHTGQIRLLKSLYGSRK